MIGYIWRDYGKKGIDDSQVAGFEMGVYQDRQRKERFKRMNE